MKTCVAVLLTLLISTMAFCQIDEYTTDLDHSSVGFSVAHLVVSKVKGRFNDFSGVIQVDSESGKLTGMMLDVKAGSIDTANKKRDAHLTNPDFFNVEKYPMLTFKSTSITFKDQKAFEMSGELTMLDKTLPVKLSGVFNGVMTDKKFGSFGGLSLSGVINRTDWGLTYNSLIEAGGVAIGEDVTVTVELEFYKK